MTKVFCIWGRRIKIAKAGETFQYSFAGNRHARYENVSREWLAAWTGPTYLANLEKQVA